MDGTQFIPLKLHRVSRGRVSAGKSPLCWAVQELRFMFTFVEGLNGLDPVCCNEGAALLVTTQRQIDGTLTPHRKMETQISPCMALVI